MKLLFVGFFSLVGVAGYQHKRTDAITPDGELKGKTSVHRNVDLRSCEWIEFETKDFDVTVNGVESRPRLMQSGVQVKEKG